MIIARYKAYPRDGPMVDLEDHEETDELRVSHSWVATKIEHRLDGKVTKTTWHCHPAVIALAFVLFATALALAMPYLLKWGIIN